MKKNLFTTLLVISTISIFGQVNLSSSLTACYALNGNATDAINSLNGTVHGVVSALDRSNNTNAAYYFSGSASDYIEIADNALMKSAVAVSGSGWFKINNFLADDHIIFTKNNSSSSFAAYSLITYNSGGAYRFRTYKESSALGTTYAESTTTLSANTWYHVAFTIDNTALKIYVNGVLENTTASAFNFDYELGKSIILGGTNESNYNTPFNGVIDNLRFYNRILTAQEILALYAQDPACKDVVMVGIKTNSFEEEMSATIYPNPTTGKINIEIKEGNLKEYEVFNLLGMRLFKGKLTDKENTITIEDYPKGVYFLKLKSERSEKTIRIVKE